MKRKLLYAYQWITGISDTATGVLLWLAPAFTLRIMGLHPAPDSVPYVSYIGAFVLSVGFACLYGVRLLRHCALDKLAIVWLLTAFTRAAVALYLLNAALSGKMELGWLSVAAFDGACVIIQGIGLRRGWLSNA